MEGQLDGVAVTRPAPTPLDDTANDICEKIAAIKARHPDYWVGNAALREAVAAWGAEGQVNECGVFASVRMQAVAGVGRGVAEVGVHRVRDGVFVHCCRFSTTASGFGYAPGVWASVPHATEQAARGAGVAELLDRLTDSELGSGRASREEVRQLRSQLRRRTEQPSLF